ncbi:diguanylate cyclase domain-containing protein [Pseudaestuariivita sp.]|uniref:diguanylate cyclase domain-containing protein n=1 Tax=Pseudaestuariivita sp. TaxID=2211669 RepID=UPI00405857DF
MTEMPRARRSDHANELTVPRLQKDTDALRRLVEEHRIFKEAIEKSPMSYCVYDADDRLIAYNAAYAALHPVIADLRQRQAQTGTPILYADLVRESIRGKVAATDLEAEVAKRVADQRKAVGEAVEREYAGGIHQRVYKYPLASGATAGIALDISELKAREVELTQAKQHAEQAEAQARTALDMERTRKTQSRQLSELGEWLQSCKSLDELFRVIERFMAQLFPKSAGELYVYSNSRDVLDGACQWNRDGQIKPHIKPDACWALRRGRVLRYGVGIADLACHHADDLDGSDPCETPYVCLPIIAHGDTVGLLHIRLEGAAQEALDDTTMAFAVQCAEQISLAIANVKLRDELQEQSTRDPLTGAFNRRYLLNACHRALSSRGAHDVALIVMDLDHFKTFNNEQGQDAGDAVLRSFAKLLHDIADHTGTLARLKSDAFVLLLQGQDGCAAAELAENIRARTAEMQVAYGGQKSILPKVTISCGIALPDDPGETPSRLLDAAEAALHAAKAAGRNRVQGPAETIPKLS